MHFCADELLALLALIPLVGVFFARLRDRWHLRCLHKRAMETARRCAASRAMSTSSKKDQS